MKKLCELCDSVANVICESDDEARLCWGCDSKVHGANFLVGKHLRLLLCHVCQAPTPWNASGPKLLPTVAFCENCTVQKNRPNGKTVRRGRMSTTDHEGCGSSSSSSNAATTDDHDDMENQVVPNCLSFSSHSTPNS